MMKSLYSIEGLASAAAAAFFLLTAGFLAAQPVLKPLPAGLAEKVGRMYSLTEEQKSELARTAETTRFQESSFTDLILPDKKIASDILQRMQKLEPTVLVETLFVIPLDSKLAARDGFRLLTYNLLRSMSTMKGIEYYSASRERMRILFEESYAVQNQESTTALPDPIVKNIPLKDTLYVFQKDSTFGKNTYETEYLDEGNALHLSMKNLTKMYYGILPLVGPEKLNLEIVVLPGEDHLLFYGCIGVKTLGLFGLEKKVHASFSNRIKALYGWFTRGLEKSGNTF